MTQTALKRAVDEVRRAQKEHARDVHDPERVEALRQARQVLEHETESLLHRLPFRVIPATQERHYAVRENVELREGRRVKGQTLCGAPSGRPPVGHPAPCASCLLVAERYLLVGPPPLELDLGL